MSDYIVIDSFSGDVIDNNIGIDLNNILWSASYNNYSDDIDLSPYFADDWLIGFESIVDTYGNEEFVTVFYEDGDLNLWFGTDKGKLIKGFKYSNKVEVYSIGPAWESITAMVSDTTGNWYMSNSQFRRFGYTPKFNYAKESNPFVSIWNEYDNTWSYLNEDDFPLISNPDINCMLNLKNQFIVLGTMSGVIMISMDNPKDYYIISKKDGLMDHAVFKLASYNEQLFIMTVKGISVYSLYDKILIEEDILTNFGLEYPDILDMILVEDNLFFSTKAGLFKYSIGNNTLDKIDSIILKQINYYDKKIYGLNDKFWSINLEDLSKEVIYFKSFRNFEISNDYIWLNLLDKIKLINITSREEWEYNNEDGFIDIEIFDIKEDYDWMYFLTNKGAIFYNWRNYHY